MVKSQRKSLADALQAESTRAPRATAPATPVAATDAQEPKKGPEKGAEAASSNTSYIAPSRRGKKVVSGYFDAAVSKQLKLLCVENDTSLQALLTEALNDLFTKHGKSPIA